MSIKDRLTKKTEGLLVPGKTDSPAAGSNSPLRTAPGQMLMVNSLMRESNDKIALLEKRLENFQGALPVRAIPPDQVLPSPWANRISDSLSSADFERLKADIAGSGGNVQPIKVRPVPGQPDRFEIVFGHRRHRACMDLGIPVRAVIDTVDDRTLFKEMERENRERANLSPWEQGCMYRRALDQGLFGSINELASELGVDKGNVSRALRLAQLPDAVVQAFRSPLDLQYRWAKLLSDAIDKDAAGVMERAGSLASQTIKFTDPKAILAALLGDDRTTTGDVVEEIVVGDRRAEIHVRDGRIDIRLPKGVLTRKNREKLRDLIRSFVEE